MSATIGREGVALVYMFTLRTYQQNMFKKTHFINISSYQVYKYKKITGYRGYLVTGHLRQ